MGFDIDFFHKLKADLLSPYICMNVGNLLADYHLGNNLRRGAYITYSKTWSKYFGEGSAVYNASFCIKRLDRRNVFSPESQVTVRIVFENNKVIF